jgi:hypothetical protein
MFFTSDDLLRRPATQSRLAFSLSSPQFEYCRAAFLCTANGGSTDRLAAHKYWLLFLTPTYGVGPANAAVGR